MNQATKTTKSTTENIIGILAMQRGSTPVTVQYTRQVRGGKDIKADNPFGDDLFKTSKNNGLLNFDYQAAVLRQGKREGKSENHASFGGSFHVPVLHNDGKMTPLCIHKETAAAIVGWDSPDGKRPLQDAVYKSGKKKGQQKPVNLADCKVNPFTMSDLEKVSEWEKVYLRYKLQTALSSEYHNEQGDPIDSEEVAPYLYDRKPNQNQGLDNEVKFLCISLRKITYIALGGEKYEIVDANLAGLFPYQP